MNTPRQTFKDVRRQHRITLSMLIEDTQLEPQIVLLMDTQSIGTPIHIDQLLASLTRLSGTEYSRRAKNIRDITFKLNPDYNSITPMEISTRLEEDSRELQRIPG
ncbi:hypothetical protein [Dictyobacter arantiisoli]|uniref:Uncharacterized protein n=1 Tax=Dictyobacter arantiisoli TaxID=2014874 RepID=A0A5A5TJG0_9CHLR|nr:hypothetical protein [Dictyobacter arantiisoli]GCF11024.1 hypothetical protein KDI_45880 [Dictyobacter arantiisoli]